MSIYVVHDGPRFLFQVSDHMMVAPLCGPVNRCLIRNITTEKDNWKKEAMYSLVHSGIARLSR